VKLQKLFLTILVLICISLFVGFVVFKKTAQNQKPISIQSSVFTIDKARYKASLYLLGPQKTYSLFKKDYANKPTLSHMAMHFMGDLLYDYYSKKGNTLEGLTVCDSTFDYGCYHQYIARLLIDHGLKDLNAIDKICIASHATDCGHGIGHGLVEFYGPSRLADVLKACKTLSGPDIATCSSGAFMNYNIPLSIGNNLVVIPRVLDKNDPIAPCDKDYIPKDFKAECYFQLPHWWFRLQPINVKQMGQWCLLVPEEYQQKCYLGIGVDLPGNASNDSDRILIACNEMPYKNATTWCLESCADAVHSNTGSCSIYPKLGLDISLCKK